MGPPGEQAEHAGGVGGVLRLAKHFFLDDNDGVRAQNNGVGRDWPACGDCLGLLTRETSDEANGVFAGLANLGHMGWSNLEGKAGLREQFAATRRCGGQNQWGAVLCAVQGGLPALHLLLAHALIPTCTPRWLQTPQAMRGVLCARP
jgi:hypothetical protein